MTELDGRIDREQREEVSFRIIALGKAAFDNFLLNSGCELNFTQADDYYLSRQVRNYLLAPNIDNQFLTVGNSEVDLSKIEDSESNAILAGIEEEDGMVAQYIGLPIHIAEEMIPGEYDDLFDILVSAGNYQLLLAVRNYDLEHESGANFMTAAYKPLEGGMKRVLALEKIIHVPIHAQELERKYTRMINGEYGGEEPLLRDWTEKAGLAISMIENDLMSLDPDDVAQLGTFNSVYNNALRGRVGMALARTLSTIRHVRSVRAIKPLDGRARSLDHIEGVDLMERTDEDLNWEDILPAKTYENDMLLDKMLSRANIHPRNIEILFAYYFENRSAQDISQEYVLHPGTINNIVRETLAKLRRAFWRIERAEKEEMDALEADD